MSENFFMLVIAALLPLTGCLLILQRDPYRALVIRGVLGAIAALAYALFGAADVALTEALVGTLLSITLYAIAVRSSMRVKIGTLETEQTEPITSALEGPLMRHHMSCKVLVYSTVEALETALATREIHATYQPSQQHLKTRVKSLYQIFQAQLPADFAAVTYTDLARSASVPSLTQPFTQPKEAQS